MKRKFKILALILAVMMIFVAMPVIAIGNDDYEKAIFEETIVDYAEESIDYIKEFEYECIHDDNCGHDWCFDVDESAISEWHIKRAEEWLMNKMKSLRV